MIQIRERPLAEKADYGGTMKEGYKPWDPSNIEPSSLFIHPFPYQIKNSIFRDKIVPGQDVDLHGIAKVGDQELMVEKRHGTQSNRAPSVHIFWRVM